MINRQRLGCRLMAKVYVHARVVVSKNGPYLVTGDVPLAKQIVVVDAEGGSESWQKGETFAPHKTTYALCRCGQSKGAPYCDGTHVSVGFDGTETASREPYENQAKKFEGPTMDMTDAEKLCAFARFCDPRGQVWSQVSQSDDPDVRATFIQQVGNCPSGRLVAWDKKTNLPVEPKLPVSIGLIEDSAEQCSGPIWLRGGIAVVSSDGFAYEVRNRVTLCRCGQSRNKPYCDGTHAQIKFQDK
jgi:CDGSH-type Zn-finger protein